MIKPTVFIGSSKEGLNIAEALFACLSYGTKPKLWTQQLYLPGQYPMEVLEKQIREHDFAVLVASPDDQIMKRGRLVPAMRDNLLVEFGLFAGVLGRERVFFVCPSYPKLELPSDLLGVIVAEYDATRINGTLDEISAAVQVPCQQIKEVIRREWELIQETTAKVASRVRASEIGRAIERLHTVVTRLRDAATVIQRDAFAALSDERAFEAIKMAAVNEIIEITRSYEEDASLIGIKNELKSLSDATMDAIKELPFPRELSMGREAIRRKAVNTSIDAINALLGGEDPIRCVEESVSEETKQLVLSLKNRYTKWWDSHYPTIEEATRVLQDKLFQATMELASKAYRGKAMI